MANIIAVLDPEDRVSESDFTSVIRILNYVTNSSMNNLQIDDITIGYQSLEDEQITQPISCDGYHLVLDGRTDNRTRLLDRLSTANSRSSDAEKIGRAHV